MFNILDLWRCGRQCHPEHCCHLAGHCNNSCHWRGGPRAGAPWWRVQDRRPLPGLQRVTSSCPLAPPCMALPASAPTLAWLAATETPGMCCTAGALPTLACWAACTTCAWWTVPCNGGQGAMSGTRGSAVNLEMTVACYCLHACPLPLLRPPRRQHIPCCPASSAAGAGIGWRGSPGRVVRAVVASEGSQQLRHQGWLGSCHV